MAFLIQYVADAAPWIYFLCGVAALFQLYRTWQVRAERRQAIFSLERDKAVNDLYDIFVRAIVILCVMGVTYFVSTILSDAVEPLVARTLEPTPQAVVLLPTPTNTPLPATETPTITPTALPQDAAAAAPQSTPVLLEQPPTATPVPAPAVAPALCPDARASILSPGNGALVSGLVSVVGTAQHDRFDYYKLEYAPGNDASQGFAYFDGGNSQVVGGLLGSLNSPAYANGVYTLRLVVVDTSGNYPLPCRVTISVQN
ncbi:MAG: hypothetical protein HY328_02285 [Chloroflexi bacterium]|nr:hypothetical protein [Chloroflexota bacterium]